MFDKQMPVEYYSLHATAPFGQGDSGARAVMHGSHLAQKLVVKGVSEKRFQTGMERALSKYVFTIKMPCDATILRVIEKYPRNSLSVDIPLNPETLVIYEDYKTKQVGHLIIPQYGSYHQYFGFDFKLTPEANLIKEGAYIEKGTVFAQPITLGENGSYNYGVELNIALMSHRAAAEDGIVVCRDKLHLFKFKVYDTRVVEFGRDEIPLNLYGTVEDYQPFPEIGSYIHPSGVLMALRKVVGNNSPVEMSSLDLMEIDHTFDRCTYVRGPKGRVIDVKVIHCENIPNGLPTGIMDKMYKYAKALRTYHREIVNFKKAKDSDLKHRDMASINTTRPFHQLIVNSMVIAGEEGARVNLLHRKNPLDQYRIEFTIEYEIEPTLGFKLTGLHGDKGVICRIAEPEEMPVDADGLRADIIMDEGSIPNRMNIGKPNEIYFDAVSYHVERKIRSMLGLQKCDKHKAYYAIKAMDPAVFDAAYRYLAGYYHGMCEKYFHKIDRLSLDDKQKHVAHIVSHILVTPLPLDNPSEIPTIIEKMEQQYRPTYGPVTFIGHNGRKITTKTNVRIAPFYVVLLEKITDDSSVVSTANLHHFGVLTPETKSGTHLHPYSASPTKFGGETEERIFACYTGRLASAEFVDRNNNPETHQLIYKQLLTQDVPTNIDSLVDRSIHPFGNTKPLQLLDHIASITGWRPIYRPEK